jgi:phosphoserine phosphatase
MLKPNTYVTISIVVIILSCASLLTESKSKKIKNPMSPEVVATCTTNLCKKTTEHKYAVFDICNSFWEKSIYDLMHAYNKKKKPSFSFYLKLLKHGTAYLFGSFDVKSAFEDFLSACKGMKRSEVEADCNALWEEHCKNYIYRAMHDIYMDCKNKNMKLILAEACTKEFYADLLKKYTFDYLCVSEMEFKDDVVTGRLIGDPCSGECKLKMVKDLIENKLGGSLREVVFYANSHNDIPLLEVVGRPVIVNPTKKLEFHANKKGWEIIKFNEFKVS